MIRKTFLLPPEPPEPTTNAADAVKDFAELALDALPLRPCESWDEFWAFPVFVIPYTLAPKESWKVIPIEGQLPRNLTSASIISAPPKVIALEPSLPGMMTVNVMLRKQTSTQGTREFIQGSERGMSIVPNVIISTPKMVHGKRADAYRFNFLSSKAEAVSKTAARLGNIHVAGLETPPRSQSIIPVRVLSHLPTSYRRKITDPTWEPLRSPYDDNDPNSFAPGIRHRVPLKPASRINLPSSNNLAMIPMRYDQQCPTPRRTEGFISGAQPPLPCDRPFYISPMGIHKPDFRALTKNARKGILALAKRRPPALNPNPKPNPPWERVSYLKPKRPKPNILEPFASIDLDQFKPGVEIPWYIIRELRPHFIGPKRFLPELKKIDVDPSIKAERVVAHNTILEELFAAAKRVVHKRKGTITLSRIPIVRQTKFPKNLVNDTDLLPFMVIPTPAEQYTLETGTFPFKNG
jgi:hypothetical protein